MSNIEPAIDDTGPGQPSTLPGGEAPTSVELSGREVAGYRLLRRLGQGAMAEVYLAEQISLGRQVALKVLKPHLADDTNYVRRFEQEARAAASLVHANLVQIYEVGRADGVHFIAQEYVPGQNLGQYMGRHGALDVSQAVSIARQVTSALCKAGELGIVHRDIKPENIMLSSSGLVKVADFGLARLTRDPDDMNLTQAGVTMGTPLYMSPEQAEGRPLDSRSDIYSLGVTCYHMLAGYPPFRGDTALAIAVKHLQESPGRLEQQRADLPDGLCRIVHKMLSKKPGDRYQDARQLLRELRALQVSADSSSFPEDLDELASQEIASLVDSRMAATQHLETVIREAPSDHPWRRRMLIALAAVVALAAGAAVARWSAEPSLLRDANESISGVERKDSARSQYFLAMELKTDVGWKAVGQYFPEETEWVYPANGQLARYYWARDDYEPAREILSALASADQVDQETYKGFGLAGLCILYFLDQDHESAKQCLARLTAMLPNERLDPIELENLLADRSMVVQIGQIAKQYERILPAEEKAWRTYAPEIFRDETSP